MNVHDYTSHNKTLLQNSHLCGCCYCLSIMPATDIVEFVDYAGDTGLCPRCNVDVIIPDVVTELTIELLQAEHNKWFST